MQEGRASEREGSTSRGSCLTSEESAQEGGAPKEHVGGKGSRRKAPARAPKGKAGSGSARGKAPAKGGRRERRERGSHAG